MRVAGKIWHFGRECQAACIRPIMVRLASLVAAASIAACPPANISADNLANSLKPSLTSAKIQNVWEACVCGWAAMFQHTSHILESLFLRLSSISVLALVFIPSWFHQTSS
ncbi:hypothetical protein FRC08_016895 [Ceratobasidium sp. 394]|nr:hypothetical protein FRC08_016895 [Ceratobasidium sp. 394]